MSAILALNFAWGVHFELASWNCELELRVGELELRVV